MKQELSHLKKARFDGNDFAPLTQLQSNTDHLNHQVADFRARNVKQLASDNASMNYKISKLKDEAN